MDAKDVREAALANAMDVEAHVQTIAQAIAMEDVADLVKVVEVAVLAAQIAAKVAATMMDVLAFVVITLAKLLAQVGAILVAIILAKEPVRDVAIHARENVQVIVVQPVIMDVMAQPTIQVGVK